MRSRPRSIPAALALALAFAAPGLALTSELAQKTEVAGALKLLDAWIQEEVDYRHLPGLSIGVVDDQELIWAKGYGVSDFEKGTPTTPRTLYRLGSVSKLFTATAILELRDAGKLSLDDRVTKLLPEFAAVKNPFVGAPAVTIRHLLTHTSGLPRDAPFPAWTTHEFPSGPEVLGSLGELELLTPPGARYHYSNLGVGLLGHVIARASGESYADYLREHVFAPLGMSASTAAPSEEVLHTRATSYYRLMLDGSRPVFPYYDMNGLASAGNVISNVEDLARFAELQFRAGGGHPAGGAQILSGWTLDEMHRVDFVYPSFSGGRGLGFGVSRDGDTTFVGHGGWIGGNRTYFLTVPARKIAVIAQINADDGNPYLFARKAWDLLAPAIAAATAVPAPAPVPDPAWQNWVGDYVDPWGYEYQVMILGGRLTVYEKNVPPDDDPEQDLTPLDPLGGTRFRMPDGESLVFELDDAGRVNRIRRRYDFLTPKPR